MLYALAIVPRATFAHVYPVRENAFASMVATSILNTAAIPYSAGQVKMGNVALKNSRALMCVRKKKGCVGWIRFRVENSPRLCAHSSGPVNGVKENVKCGSHSVT